MADGAPAAIDTRIVTDEWTELDSVPLDDPELERDGEFAIAAPAPEGFLDFLESPRLLLSVLLALLALLALLFVLLAAVRPLQRRIQLRQRGPVPSAEDDEDAAIMPPPPSSARSGSPTYGSFPELEGATGDEWRAARAEWRAALFASSRLPPAANADG